MARIEQISIPTELEVGIAYARAQYNAGLPVTIEGDDGNQVPNPARFETDSAYFQQRVFDVLNSWTGQSQQAAPPTPTPVAVSGVPQEVTRRQAMQALINRGKLDAVKGAIAAIPDPVQKATVQNEFDNSQSFQRYRATTLLIAQAAGITDLDEWFTYAASL
jgi:hypothetical protein